MMRDDLDDIARAAELLALALVAFAAGIVLPGISTMATP